MNYTGIVAVLAGSFGVIVTTLALQFVNTTLPEKERRSWPVWSLAAASLLLGGSLYALRGFQFADGQMLNTLALTATMIGGVLFKWLCETIAQKKLALHEAVLTKALLVAPLAVLLLGSRVFPTRLGLGAIALWFFNGYFWHAFLSDIERMARREKVVIRRREPPTLPHDFKRPETD